MFHVFFGHQNIFGRPATLSHQPDHQHIWGKNVAESVDKYRPKDHKARPKEIPSAVSIVEAHLRKKTLEWLKGNNAMG